MAFTPRKITQIQNQILAEKANQTALDGLTSTSVTAYWILWSFIMAVGISLLEQIMSIFIGEVETIVAEAVPGTPPWIQNEVLKFQYSVTTPQVVQVNSDFTIGYAIISTAFQIISNCAVIVTGTSVLNIKVTTGSPAGALDANQQIALKSYLNTVLPAGQIINLITGVADELAVYGTVYYNGQYNASIQANVIAALDAYITKFSTSTSLGGSFNGMIKISDIENIILGVEGVVDWVPTQITATSAGAPAFNLIAASTIYSRSYQAFTGYIKNEVANPFSSTLLFSVAQN
jgi:hypothetical protein